MTVQEDKARRQRTIRLALLFALLAATFFSGFIVMTGLR